MSDELLLVLSRRGEVAWPTCRRYIDELHARLAGGQPKPRNLETVTTSTLQSLGHITVDFTEGSGVVRVAPRVLARLPVAGRPTAVLVGHRTADNQELFLDSCGRVHGAWATASAGGGEGPFIPYRLSVETDSVDDLATVAAAVEARFDPDPAAWRVLQMAETVDTYRRSLLWRVQQDLNWERRDFDVDSVRWTALGASGDGLAEFTDPRTSRRTYRLRRGDRVADVDRAWGCYIALAAAVRNVLYYDGEAIFIPLSARLPAPFDTALTLCSGFAPRVVRITNAPGCPAACLRYSAVPQPLADLAAAKLGQCLVPVPSPEALS
jgi:hypothetical protein